ncbi:MAG: hypothetical protein CMI32_06985 [Opitutales bacterium]|nr:hypothetical protein [Opitutales bacterium]
MRPMSLFRVLFQITAGLTLPALTTFAEVKETRQLISEWVQTERLISEEKAQWEADRELLGDLIATLKAENKALDENLAKSEAEMVDVSNQRAGLNERRAKAEEAAKVLDRKINELERRALTLLPAFPSPLRERVGRFAEAIESPKRSNQFSLRERLENAVAVLQAANLFHQAVSLEKQKFTIEGKTREFQVLYYGFSVAYFVNDAATTAGYGMPGPSGWQWTQDDDLAAKVSQAVAIRNKRAMATFVELPLPMKPVSKPNEEGRE